MMYTKPIPVPPQGASLKWELRPPYSARHLLILLFALALLVVTGHRVEMDRMLMMSAQAVGQLIGVSEDSQVVRGLSRVAQSMWPPVIEEREEVARLPQLDRDDLPLFAYIEMQQQTEQRLNPQTLQLQRIQSCRSQEPMPCA